MKSLNNCCNKFKKLFYFTFIIPLVFISSFSYSNTNNSFKASKTIQLMLIEAKEHAIITSKLAPEQRTKKIKLLIEKYINLEFMAKATTGAFWKKANVFQRDKYKLALLNQIISTIEVHLNKLSTLTYRTLKTELRGKRLVYVRGIIEDPKKKQPSIKILWKLASNKQGDFVILDLEIESVSLVSSHKAENIWESISDGLDEIQIGKRTIQSRAYVGQFNFKGSDQQKIVSQLSGGERNRVHLAKILKNPGNVLLLDEPTNDLDVDTLRALEEAILNFSGCVIVISHDRWFLNKIATHILAFEGSSHVEWFEGNYQDYEADKKSRLGEEALNPKRIKYKPISR